MKLRYLSKSARGFTLTEVLVSSALIVAIMGLMLTTVDQTRRTISNTTGRLSQFQSARIAFEAMTRNLSQATLNTYWDVDKDENKNPQRYRRNSDLHFVMGRTATTTPPQGSSVPKFFGGNSTAKPGATPETEAFYPGHAVFFQAPLGFTTAEVGSGVNTSRAYSSLTNLLANVGYYVKWDKETSLPPFIAADPDLVADRYRYRLMEVLQPGEVNMIFNNTNYTAISNLAGGPDSPYDKATDWIQVALGRKALPTPLIDLYYKEEKPQNNTIDYSRPLAENIVAVILLPKRAEQDRDNAGKWDDLTQNYEYDSRVDRTFSVQAREVPQQNGDTVTYLKSLDYRLPRQMHQLPPIIQVTMIAIDEESAVKLQDWVLNTNNGVPPDWMNGLFKEVSTPQAFLTELGDPAKPGPESLIYQIGNPDRKLDTPPLNYRVFTTDVVMRGAKWSNDERYQRNF